MRRSHTHGSSIAFEVHRSSGPHAMAACPLPAVARPQRGRIGFAALLMAVTLSGPALAGAGEATPEQHYQLALEARTERNYQGMLGHLREAARGGDRPAQELLVSVLLAGPRLSGGAIAADLCEAGFWADRAAAQGSAVGRHQQIALNAHRHTPGGRAACSG